MGSAPDDPLLIACPACHAPRDKPCRDRHGIACPPHQARVQAATTPAPPAPRLVVVKLGAVLVPGSMVRPRQVGDHLLAAASRGIPEEPIGVLQLQLLASREESHRGERWTAIKDLLSTGAIPDPSAEIWRKAIAKARAAGATGPDWLLVEKIMADYLGSV